MRVLVVDDSAFMRRAISTMLNSDPEIQVVGLAKNGVEAIEFAKKLKPDVITLDIEMPEMDGLTALRRIMRESPTQVLMVSSLTTEGSHASLQALRLGAADVLAKEMSQISLNVSAMHEDLLQRIKALANSTRFKHTQDQADITTVDQPPSFRPGQFDVICIGSSTGGPPVLETIIGSLKAEMTTPIIVAQHMPEIFTRSMSERLDEISGMHVVHAENGMPIQKSTVYVAPGGHHTHLHKDGLAKWSLRVNDEPKKAIYKPSVTALFESAAQATGSRSLAIVLTGIGDDGLLGARKLHETGGIILAQSQETCVVYGMPKAVTQAAITAASLCPTDITKSLLSLVKPALAA